MLGAFFVGITMLIYSFIDFLQWLDSKFPFPNWLIYTIIVLVGFPLLFVWVIKPWFRFYNQIIEFFENINYISAELKPNHGSSIKDKINSIDARISDIGHELTLVSQKMRIMFTIHPKIALLELSNDGNLISINKKWSEWTGLTIDDSYGHGWLNGVVDNDVDIVLKALRDSQSQKRDICIYTQLKNTEENGSYLNVKIIIFFISDKDNNPLGYILLVQEYVSPKVTV